MNVYIQHPCCGRNVHSPGTSREQVKDVVRVLVPLGEDLARAVPFHSRDVALLQWFLSTAGGCFFVLFYIFLQIPLTFAR